MLCTEFAHGVLVSPLVLCVSFSLHFSPFRSVPPAPRSPLGSLSLSLARSSGYIGNFRQVLFEQLQGSVVDLPSMQSVMMYNEFQTNPTQRGGAGWAIAARYDLRTPSTGGPPSAYGALDSKITSDSWMKAGQLRVSTTSGPTHMTQEPFCWTGPWAAQQPKGSPLCFDFPWIQYAVGEEMVIQEEEEGKVQMQ